MEQTSLCAERQSDLVQWRGGIFGVLQATPRDSLFCDKGTLRGLTDPSQRGESWMSLGARGLGAALCRTGGWRSSALPSCSEVMPVVGCTHLGQWLRFTSPLSFPLVGPWCSLLIKGEVVS